MVKQEISGELDNAAISRYSRQLILPEIGVKGQQKLSKSSVLIVGAGGLGCPAGVYLAAAGVGCVGFVDYDEVEISNLHRQILHAESRVGVEKSASASYSCHQLNSTVKCVPYHFALDSSNALQLIQQYDVVLDASDNVATRYLLNDACVLAGKPLVSGSALRFEGQLTVYNHEGGPCYRCLFPQPPPPETVTNCSDGGVLGAVPGVIGTLQALEAIKLIAGCSGFLSQRLLLFDGLPCTFRNIKLRPRQKHCAVCGDTPTITKLIDYEQFCGAKATDKTKTLNVLEKDERITVKEYKSILDSGKPHLLVDVRMAVEMDICQLPNTWNLPIKMVERESGIESLKEKIFGAGERASMEVFVVCRQGNDSQSAVRTFKEKLGDTNVVFKDIIGGLKAWKKQIDPDFPDY